MEQVNCFFSNSHPVQLMKSAQITMAPGLGGGGKAGASLGGEMVQNTKGNGAKASVYARCIMCIICNDDSYVQGKLMGWEFTPLLEAKAHMKESGETGKHMVLENLQVQLVKR